MQGCFSSVLGMGFAFEAELVGVMMAVDIAFSKGWHSFWIESDSIYVVSLLRSRSMIVPWNHRNRWLYTLHLIRQIYSCDTGRKSRCRRISQCCGRFSVVELYARFHQFVSLSRHCGRLCFSFHTLFVSFYLEWVFFSG